MRTYNLILFVMLCLGFFAAPIFAQQCRPDINPTTQLSRFIKKNGEILDQFHNVLWMRCSVGQRWNTEKKICTGRAANLSRQQTLSYINQLNSDQDHQWRLPSLPELTSLTELRCIDPAINLKIFNNTPPTHYWSATPFMNRENQYWLVQFYSGESHVDSDKRTASVRLVRNVDYVKKTN